jgi:DNA-binding transcriptional LysR family regulator
VGGRREARHPGCQVRVVETDINEPYEPLYRGKFDLMATWLPRSKSDLIEGPTLNEEPRVLAVAPDHPLAKKETVSVEDLADYQTIRLDTIRKEWQEVWAPSTTPSGRSIRRDPLDKMSSGDRGRMSTEISYLVATGRIVHPTVPSIAGYWGHPEIVYIPITDMAPLRSVLVWPRRPPNRRREHFVRIAAEVLTAAQPTSPP